MFITTTPDGYEIKLLAGEAKVLLEELGDVSSRSIKIRQLHRDLESVMRVVEPKEKKWNKRTE